MLPDEIRYSNGIMRLVITKDGKIVLTDLIRTVEMTREQAKWLCSLLNQTLGEEMENGD